MEQREAVWHLTNRGSVSGHVAATVHDTVLYLDNQHLMWFGHFLLDLMTRAWAFEYCKSFLGLRSLKVLCSRPAPPYAATLFRMAGIPVEDVLFFDKPVGCRSLIVATKALQIQEYTTPAATRLWHGMRDRASVFNSEAPKRIYVSRRANPTRALAEEERTEVIFRDRGFVVIYPETLDVTVQINLFASADLIAGCSGSNMFNLAFVRNARSAFILVSPLLIHYQEQLVAAGSGLSLEFLIGYVDQEELDRKPGYVHANWHVDPAIVEECVDDWLGRYPSSLKLE